MTSVTDFGDVAGSSYGLMSPRTADSPYGGAGMPAVDQPKILLMGPRRAGKSSIQRVVFQKMSPHETLFLEATNNLDIKFIANNSFVQFQIWDLPGDYDFRDIITYDGQTFSAEAILNNCGAIIYVVDAQDDPYTEALENLLETIMRAHEVNPEISVDVFIHKVDGDLFLGDEAKLECQNAIESQVMKDLAEAEISDMRVSFYLTSIYDHSVFDTFSRVVQKLIPQLPTLENLLNSLIASCGIEKAFLFDVVSKIYIATDSNPVDVQSYELCSDMIDVVIDVSCIYGMKDEGEGFAYDSKSASMIRLTGGEFNGSVLYLREVSSYLALVCLLKEENFEKHGLIDYNIDAFKAALGKLFQVAVKRRKGGARASELSVSATRGTGRGAGLGAGAGASAERFSARHGDSWGAS